MALAPGPAPARVPAPALPAEPLAPRPGRWLWTCRAGFEPHLYEELAWQGARPRLLCAALVEADRAVKEPPAFGRMGFPVAEVFEEPLSAACSQRMAQALTFAAKGRPLQVQAWTPDSDRGNAHAGLAQALGEAVRGQLAAAPSAEVLGQLCVLGASLAAVGVVDAGAAVSRAPGGRNRMRREADAPSRAAMKLEEALDGYGLAPSRGESCVDLGAAPGGWTARLVARGAKVIAVDPANLTPELAGNPRVRHVKASAFAFEPDEPADWLFCDMAWRPLEVAQLLAKWGRRGWALHLVANIKLPMKDKNPILHRVRATLESGWGHLRVRQLYHDRDEVTVTARRGG
ncbi:MAG: SAM-dependent methyltransferase [Myxococcaceae bacterium]